MVDRPREDRDSPAVAFDPVTGELLHEKVINPIVRGDEIDPVEVGDEESIAASGPEEDYSESGPVRPDDGTQLFVQINPGDDREEIKRKAREAWRAARKRHGLD